MDFTTGFSPEFSNDLSNDFTTAELALEFADTMGLRVDLSELDHEVRALEGSGGWLSATPPSSYRSSRGGGGDDDDFPLSRPKRLLSEPELVGKDGDFLIHPRSGKVWRILRWEDSEMEGMESRTRDYYRVIAVEQRRSGSRRPLKERQLWVFSSHNQPGFYLSGYFD